MVTDQVIINRENVIIEHTLGGAIEAFVGTFTCVVQDYTRRTATQTVSLNGGLFSACMHFRVTINISVCLLLCL